MDLLGKEGEEARKNVEQLSGELRKLESHLNAVDSALQDFVDRFQQLESGEQNFLEEELARIEDAADSRYKLEERLDRIEKKQRENSRKLEELYDSGLMDTIKKLRDAAEKSQEISTSARKELRQLENRVDDLEGELIMEMNRRDYDFEQKLDTREFREEKENIFNEIKKLRASLNVLADEVDAKDSIKTD